MELTTQKDSTQNKSGNALMVIAPYWSSGTWVFDDPSRGLMREPFVSGVPEVLNDLVREIPNARAGFRLLFSASPFPGYQAEYKIENSEYGGTWYCTSEGKRGWLCPALFKYFSSAPKQIYARAEPLS